MSLSEMWVRFSLWRTRRAVKREEARHGGREKMIDDMIVKAAGLRCGMTYAEALAMKAQILAAMTTEEAYWRPGKVTLEDYE